jgi:hypothetical protein
LDLNEVEATAALKEPTAFERAVGLTEGCELGCFEEGLERGWEDGGSLGRQLG